jgi:hypothetical protein
MNSMRRQLGRLPIPVAILCAGLLLDAAATVWDLAHFDAIFNYGNSQAGAIASAWVGGLTYLKLGVTAVAVPGLWVAARRARLPGSRSPGVVGPVCVLLAGRGAVGILGGTNDGTDPNRLGIVHDTTAPAWISASDAIVPYAVFAGAAGAAFLVWRAFLIWARRP